MSHNSIRLLAVLFAVVTAIGGTAIHRHLTTNSAKTSGVYVVYEAK